MTKPTAATVNRPRWRRWLQRLAAALLVLFVAASALPYLLPRGAAVGSVPQQPFPDSRFIRIDSVSWHHRVAGPPSGGLVVLIHGFAGSTANWDRARAVLHQHGWRTLAIDLPAFGYSDRNALPADESRALWQLIDAERGAQPVALIGHSMGAGVVTRLALARPDDVRRLVLVDGGPAFGASRHARALQMLLSYPPVPRWVDWYAGHWLYTPETFTELLTGALGRPPTAAELDSYLKPMQVAGTSEAILRRMTAPRTPLPADAAQRLTMPLILIWGRDDTWVPLAVGQRTQQRFPQATLQVIDGAGHNPMETHIDAFGAVLIASLSKSGQAP